VPEVVGLYLPEDQSHCFAKSPGTVNGWVRSLLHPMIPFRGISRSASSPQISSRPLLNPLPILTLYASEK